jgi:SAM-dependent methyltransferase
VKLVRRDCPLCGSREDGPVFAEARFEEEALGAYSFASRKTPEFMHHRLIRCTTCDTLYASPAPESSWIGARYREADFDAVEESRHAAHTYARQLQRFSAELPDKDGALDVGAGDGAFLAELQKAGFRNVVGVEPSRAPIAAAPSEVQPLLREGFIEPDAVAAESLSLVTCFQTLEHADDPARVAAIAYKGLKPGGVFFAVTHNFRALSARLLGTRSPIYDIEHLQLFSPRSLRFLLERAGFERVRVAQLRNEYPLAYWIRLLPLRESAKLRLRQTAERIGIARLQVPIFAGNLWALGSKPRV